MPKLPVPRPGEELQVKGRTLPFSFWPVYRTTRRYGVRPPRTFVSNPWLLIRRSILGALSARPASLENALAFADQAEDYLRVAGGASLLAAKPVLLYYGLMNLAKAYIVSRQVRPILNEAYHGLKVRYGPAGQEFAQSVLNVHASTGANLNVFDDFATALGRPLPTSAPQYRLAQLLPQDLLGNQLWSAATDDPQRFFKIDALQFMHDKGTRQIWLRLFTYADERRLQGGLSVGTLLSRSGLAGAWHQVASPRSAVGRTLDCLEQSSPVTYTGRPSDNVAALVESVKPYLWTLALSDYPFRQYYLYADPSPGRSEAVPQLLSVYALMFYFGSMTRYQPNLFRAVLGGPYGAQVEEFLGNQPSQFLYLLASEFQQQDVAQGALL